MLALLRVMANTPYGSWPGNGHFGLRELLEQSVSRPEKIQVAIEEINRTLVDLGVTNFLVEDIISESSAGEGTGRWTVNLVSTADRTKTYAFEWGGRTQ